MPYTASDHTFAVCAYQESPYLEESVRSVLAQTEKSRVFLSTSTPNAHIRGVAQKYSLPLFVNEGEAGIAGDWNFAYRQAQTPLVTLCHQDDIYKPDYLERALALLNGAEQPLLFFCDYHELRGDAEEESNHLLRVKRLLLSPLKLKVLHKSRFTRRRVLSLGCPVCCPSVTFVKPNLPDPVFTSGYKSDVDWQAWERLSRRKGSFVYCPRPLLCHRIHPDSETSRVLGENARLKEDYEMFCRFWPAPIARLLVKAYAGSQKSNDV